MLTGMFTLRGLKAASSANAYLIVLICFEYLALERVFTRRTDRDPEKAWQESWKFWLSPVGYLAALELVFIFDRSNVAFIYFHF